MPRRGGGAAPPLAALLLACLLLPLAALVAAPAQAQTTYVSNTGESGNNTVSITTLDQAQVFSTGAQAGGYPLGSVDIYFRSVDATDVDVEIWSTTGTGANTVPDAKLYDLTSPALLTTATSTTLSFTAPDSTTLAPSTSYAVVITRPSGAGNLFVWATATDAESVAEAGWTIADGYRTWQISSSTWGTNTNAFMIAVKGTGTTPTPTNDAPTLVYPIPDQVAMVDTVFSYAFPDDTFADADGDNLTYTATKDDDSVLPSWLSFAAGTRTFSGTPAAADAGTLSVKVTASDGTASVSNEFKIRVAVTDVCTRTPQVSAAIVDEVSGVDHCADLTAAHLAAITGTLDLSSEGVSSLEAGDFAGLTKLEVLDLFDNSLSSLPDGIFAPLTALEELELAFNSLSSLPAGVFDDLTKLTRLDLAFNQLSLSAGIFDKLTKLEDLDLTDNGLTSVPAGIFDELTALEILYLRDNDLATLPDDIFEPLTALNDLQLHTNPGASFSPTAGAGADQTVVTGASVTLAGTTTGAWGDNVTWRWTQVNGPASDTEVTSGAVTLDDDRTAAPSFTAPATAATLHFRLVVTPHPNATNGLARSTDWVTVKVAATDVCGRTPEVRDAIVGKVSGVSDCADLTPAQLAAITGLLGLGSKSISSLKAGDFAGLTSLQLLFLSDNSLSTLPAGIFDGLAALGELHLSDNGLSSLPANVFDELTVLTYLYLQSNSLSSLPAGVFDELTALTRLYLHENSLASLPAGVFEELTALSSGRLRLQENAGAPFSPTVSAGADRTVLTGASVTLAGTATGAWRSNVTWEWEQVDGPASNTAVTGGGAVTLDDDAIAGPSFTAPATATTLHFKLVVTPHPGADNARGLVSATDWVSISTTNAPTVANAIPDQTATVDTPFSYAFPTNTFEDADGDPLTYTATKPNDSALPSWLSFTAATRTFAGTPAVADAGTVRVKVTASDGTGSVSDTFDIKVATTDVCDRTAEVRDGIVAEVSGVSDCADVTPAHLAAIDELSLDQKNISSLTAGDFAGLTALEELFLGNNGLSSLPADIFDELAALEKLEMGNNSLSALPAGVFDELTSLTKLDLAFNSLSSLPAGIFDRLGNLEILLLLNNNLSSSSLPDDIFEPLTALTDLSLSQNPGATFRPTVSAGADQSVEPGESVTLLGTATGAWGDNVTWQWTQVDGPASNTAVTSGAVALSDDSIAAPSFTAPAATTLYFKLVVTPRPGGAGLDGGASATDRVTVTVTSTTDATLNALALTDADGDAIALTPPFAPTVNSYTASVVEAVDTVTVAATVNNSNASRDILDGSDATLTDADGNAPGFQVALATGANTVKVKVTAADDNTTDTYTVTVTRASADAPTVANPIPDQNAPVDVAFSYAFPADAFDDDDPLSYTATKADGNALPSWLSFTAATRTFAGTPAAANIGTVSVKVTASDGTESVSDEFDITVFDTAVCNRTDAVIDAILEEVPVSNCANVTDTHLAAIDELDLADSNITSLKAGDFAGLTGLVDLFLINNDLSALPAGIFDDLSALEYLDLDFNGLSSLPAGVFDKLVNLEELYLTNNSLSSLPDDIFDPLTALTKLYLNANSGAPFRPTANAGADRTVAAGASVTLAGAATGPWGDNVTWEWTQVNGPASHSRVTGAAAVTLSDDAIAAPSFTAPAAGTTLHFRLVVTPQPSANASEGRVVSAADWVSISTTNAPTVANAIPDQTATAGAEFSYAFPADAFEDADGDPLTYTATKADDSALPTWLGFTAATRTFAGTPEVADAGTLSVKVTASDGTASISDTFDIEVAATDVCSRTAEVRDAIVAEVSGVDDCADLTPAHLAAITGDLYLESSGISSLAAGDFAGLTGMTRLLLGNNSLSSLPAGIFDELTNLTKLDLAFNSLSSLPAGVFDRLVNLEILDLLNNNLSSLPDDVFDKLTALTDLSLNSNPGATFRPTVSAGADQSVEPGASVTLPGTATGAWGDNVTWRWTQVDGPASNTAVTSGAVTLDDDAIAGPSFTAPAAATTLYFKLVVTPRPPGNGLTGGASATDRVTVTVTSTTDATLRALALTDADGDAIALTPPFAPGVKSYTASVPEAVDTVTVAATVHNSNASRDILDGSDATLTDADANAPGFQVALATGANTVKVKVTAADDNTTDTYTVTVTRASTNAPTVANPIPDQSVPFGAPFSYAFPADTFEDADGDPLTYTATKADGNALPSWLGFTAGTRTFAGTPAAADAGTLSVKVTASDGTESVSDEFDITVFDPAFCARTPAVRDAIVDAVSGVTDCADVTAAHLAAIDYLGLDTKSISSLTAGDLAGLTGLERLDLFDNSLTSLAPGVFDDLTSLTDLDLRNNSLSSLAPDVFDQLADLTILWLINNSLSSLPDDIFDDLTALTDLTLNGNPGAPFRPTANAGADQTVEPGASVTLAGAATGAWGDNVTWQWTQVDGPASNTAVTSGAVTLDDDTIAGPSFTAPAAAATLHFKLVVTPHPSANASEGRANGADWVTVTAAAASTDATLSDLDVTWDDSGTATDITLSPNFSSGTTAYTASVAFAVDRITVAPTANDSGADCCEYLDDADMALTDADTNTTGFQFDLAEGANTIEVKVTAADTSTTETYTVTVTRTGLRVWESGLTVGASGDSDDNRGFYDWGSTDYGSLTDDSFSYLDDPSIELQIVAASASGVLFKVRDSYDTLGGLVLEWAGEVLPLDDATLTGTNIFVWSEAWLSANAASLNLATFQTTLPVGGNGNVCLRTATATCPSTAVTPANNAPTGAVTIDGGAAARVGRALTAKTDTIGDADGLTAPGFSYSWFHQDAPGTELGTGQAYTPVASDEGKAIQVRVTFTDDAGFEETLTSAATTAVSPAPVAPSDAVWSATLTPALRDPGLIRERLGCLTGGDLPQRCSNPAVLSEDAFTHAGTDYVIWALFITTDDGDFQIDVSEVVSDWAEAAQRLTLVIDGEVFPFADADRIARTSVVWFDSGLEDILVAGTPVTVWLQEPPNHPAGGAPDIDGTPQVDQTLTATKGDIADADNLPTTDFPDGYSFQWVRVDADGVSNPTDVGLDRDDYTVVADDLGKKLKVEVTFTDGGFTEETLPSDATAAVVAAQGACPAGNDWCETMTAEKSVAGSVTTFGYDSSDSLGSLTGAAIVYGGTTYTVGSLQVTDTSGSRVLAIDLDEFAPHGSVFDIGGTAFTADTASETSTTGQYEWAGVADPGWLDGQQVRVSANLAPVVTGATVDDDQLVLTFAEDLDTTSKPAADAFTVSVDGGADAAPSSVDTISGKTVTLTLATAADSDDTVTVAYTPPGTNPLQDTSGIAAPAFAAGDFTVTNNTGVGNNAPTVANAIPDQAATVGTAFSYAFPANTFDDADGDNLTYTATKADDNALPSWLSFTASTRTFAGNPAAADVGTLSVKVTASDGAASVSDTFDIEVATNTAPTVANAIPDQAATVDTAFSYAFPANTFDDADGDNLTYTATKADDNALPSWLSFTASTRTFAGNPAAADVGTLSVKVTASDGAASVSDTFDIEVATNTAPTVANAIPDQTAIFDDAFSYAFPANTFEDADSDPLTYTATKADDNALPAWLSFTASTRTFAGTPAATDAGTVSVKVTASDGTASVSDTFDIVVAATDVCDRTPQVRDAIVAAVSGVTDCADLTPAHLAAIDGLLDLGSSGISSLKAGDFAGLTGLTQLFLFNTSVSSLPAGIFDPLTALEALQLSNTGLSSLPAGVFDRLTALEYLYLGRNTLSSLPDNIFDRLTALTLLQLGSNNLSSLPDGIFDELAALETLYLRTNNLSSLPDGIFDELAALETLYLHTNNLSSLPDGIFDPLIALTDLQLQGNTGAPFSPTASAGADQSVEPGASVTLAGAATGAWGDNVTWQWTQVDGPASNTEVTSGAVTLDDDVIAGPSFTAPSTSATLHFKLVVTPHPGSDNARGLVSAADWISITTTNAPTVANAIPDRTAAVGVEFSYAFPADTFEDADGDNLTYTATKADDNALPAWLSFTAATRTFAGTPAAADVGTLSVKVTASDGTASVSDTFDIKVAATDVCNRTAQVRDAIVAAVSGVTDCADLTPAHLAAITGSLDFLNSGISSLDAGDFAGLTGLTALFLNDNGLSSLPAHIFDELTALTSLDLNLNSLSSLPADIFDELTALTSLALGHNSLSSLPAGIFDELTALTALDLSGNPGAPFSPTASAGADQSVETGASVTLAGAATGAWGDNVTWQWTQVDGPASDTEVTSGAVTLDDDAIAGPSFTAPATAATLHFKLVVTPHPGADTSAGRASGADWVTVTVASTVATLSDLDLTWDDGGTATAIALSPTFASGTTAYTASVASSVHRITVTPMFSDSNATAKYFDAADSEFTDADSNAANGFQVNLAEGANTIKVKVTAEDGMATETYEVTVTRALTPIVVGFAQGVYEVKENTGTFTVTIKVTSPADGATRQFTLSLNTSDTTAVAGEDYVAVSNQAIGYIGAPGEVSKSHQIIIVGDNDLEDDETFTATLTLASGSDVTISPATATITIEGRDAIGQPEITGTPQVGQTLTATDGDMADADNLPSGTFPTGYTFQWVQVNSSNVETDISGATSSTYVPVAADVGNTLKVKVAFTDGGGAEERRASDATAAVMAATPTPTPSPGGTTYVSNLENSTNSSLEFGTAKQAQVFSTGAQAGGYPLDSVGIHFESVHESSALNVELWSTTGTGANTVPDAKLFNLALPDSLTTASSTTLSFTAPDSTVLDPSTSYAVVVTRTTGGLATVWKTSDLTETGLDGWSIADDYRRLSSGSWLPISGPWMIAVKGTGTTPTASTDATLSDLGLTWDDGGTDTAIALSPIFAPATTSYTASVANSVDSVTLTATKNDDGATVVITDDDDTSSAGTAEFDLDVGTNTLTVTVTAEDGNTTQAYTVVVTRAEVITVGYDPVAYEATENGVSVTFTAKVTSPAGGAPRAFTLSITTADVSAVSPGDYGGVTGQLLPFNPGDVSQTHTITIIDDPDLEDDETFQSTLSLFSGDDVTISAPTATVTIEGRDATGAPGIGGTPQVGQTLTATAGTMADDDNLPTGTFPTGYTFQWVQVNSSNVETDISGATSSTYVLAAADVGNTIKVEVSFTDGGGTEETLASDETDAVVAAQTACPTGNDWCATMTVEEYSIGGDTFLGYASSNVLDEGALSDATIDYGGDPDPYTVTTIRLADTGGADAVVIHLNAFLPRGSVFSLGETEFTADGDSEYMTAGVYVWDAPSDFAWIDGEKVTVSASLPPALDTATVDGDSLVLTYFEDLDPDSKPAESAFEVKVEGGAGAAPSVVAISGETVTLTLATAVTSGQTVTVSYTVPGSDPLQDTSGLEAAPLTDHAVSNKTDATNTAPMGKPGIDGTPQVGWPLEANVEAITDADGLPSGTFPTGYSFQWVRVDADGVSNPENVGTDSETYTPVAGDVGKKLKVAVTFTDGGGTEEMLESDVTAHAVLAQAGACLTGDDWCATMTVGVDAGTSTRYGYDDGTVSTTFGELDGTAISLVETLHDPNAPRYAVHAILFEDAATDHFILALDIFVPSGTVFDVGGTELTANASSRQPTTGRYEWAADSDPGWIEGQRVTVSARVGNFVAQGQPAVTGTAQVGQTLTATTSGITDTNGIPPGTNTFTYQWYRVDSDGVSNQTVIGSATSSTYTLVAADAGKRVIVEVSFTDDHSNAEGPFASDAFPSSGTVTGSDTIAPAVRTATVSGTSLVIVFDETLAPAASLANGAFTVKKTPAGGSEATVALTGSPSIDGEAVTLTLAVAVASTDTQVKVSYATPTTGTGNRLEDGAGNAVASFTDEPVTNATGSLWSTTLAIGDGNGRGFSSVVSPAVGALGSDTFVHAGAAHRVRRVMATATGVTFETDGGGADFGGLVLEWAGEVLPLDAAQRSANTFTWSQSWLESNTYALTASLYARALPAGGIGRVCLRTAGQSCPPTLDLSFDASLSALALTWDDAGTETAVPLSPAFASGTTGYTASVANAASHVTVTPTPTVGPVHAVTYVDAGDTVLGDADPGADGHQVALGVGANTITVKIRARDIFTTQAYTVVVTRAAPAAAGTLVSNIDKSSGGSIALGGTNNVVVAQKFRVPAGADHTLHSVRVRMGAWSVNRQGVATIRQGGGTNPGTTLHTLAEPGSRGSGNKTFLAPAGVVLEAGKSYFVVMESGSGSGAVEVALTGDDGQDGLAGWSIDNQARRRSSGTWNDFSPSSLRIDVRGTAGSNAPALSALTLRDAADGSVLALDPAFDAGTQAYTATVGHLVERVTLAGTPNADVERVEYLNPDGDAYLDMDLDTPELDFTLQVGTKTFDVKLTGTDGKVERTYTLNVVRPERLTAWFTGLPDSHDGATAFTFRIQFSEDLAGTQADILTSVAAALEIDNATTPGVANVGASLRAVDVTVTPSSAAPVGIHLRAATDCSQAHSLCGASGKHFAGDFIRWVSTVDDARLRALWLTIPNDPTSWLDGSPAFDPDTFAYRAEVPEAVSRVRLSASPYTPGAKVSFSGVTFADVGDRWDAGRYADVRLDPDRPVTVTATVTAADGTTEKVYTYTVERSGVRPVDPHIRSVTVTPVGGGVVTSSRLAGRTYSVWVSQDTTEVTVSAETVDRDVELQVRRISPGLPELGAGERLDVSGRPVTLVITLDGHNVPRFYLVHIYRGGEAGLSVADAVANEADPTMEFRVTLVPAATERVTVGYATVSGTAVAGADYEATSGRLAFAAGESVRTVAVALLDDTVEDSGETFTLRLSNPSGAPLVDSEATGTIVNMEALEQQADPGALTPAPVALTAAFDDVPEEHDGSGVFILRLAFSEAPKLSFRTLRDEALTATGGTVKRARRVVKGQNGLWDIHVEPAGNGDVTVALAATAPCGEPGAICTADGKALANAPTASVQGPPGLAVADAEVEEGPDAALAFAVTLSRASSATVTVDYATADETAAAGADYTETSGTLTFLAGETAKTVAVPVIDDVIDEGSETLTLTLANPSGGNAWLADATATGTIRNSDHMPRAWLARFGRTVADQVLDAVEGRMTAPRAAGSAVTVAGHTLDGEVDAQALEAREAEARLEAFAEWMRGEATEDRTGLDSREVTARELLTGSSFAVTGGSAAGGFGAVWGRGAVTRFDGREGDLTLDGEVASAMVGADFTRGRATAGLVLSHSRGEGGYRAPSGDGEVESTLTGLYPWGRYEASERLSVWGVAGYGAGTLTLTPDGKAPIETDVDLAMAAVGGRSVLAKAPAQGGLELAAVSDALVVRTTSEEVRESEGRSLAAAAADVTRLRLGLEGTWRGIGTEGGGAFEPRFELGVRHDGGDAETGFGADIGAGVAWSDPSRGVQAELSVRGLVTHEAGGFGERGLAGSLAWDPAPDSDRGPSLTLRQTVGAQASGGMDALLRPETAGVFDAAGGEDESRRLEAKVGYGLALFGGGWTGTPELGLGLSESARETTLGWRLAEVRRSGLVFGLDLKGARRESEAAAPEHRLTLGFGWRLEGAGREEFEVRLEAQRHEASGGDRAPEHRVGVTLSARW